MRNIICLLLVIIFAIASQAVAQVVPYNENHTVSDFKNFLLGSSVKSEVCKARFLQRAQSLLKDTLVITEANVPWLCKFLYREEITLPRDGYENTDWDDKTQNLVPCAAHYYPGFSFILRVGSYEEVIAKGNCFNFIKFQIAKREAPEPAPFEHYAPQRNQTYSPPQYQRGDVQAYSPPQYQRGDVQAYSPPVCYGNYQYSGGYSSGYYPPDYQNCSQQQYDYRPQPMEWNREHQPMEWNRGGGRPMEWNRGGGRPMGGSSGGTNPSSWNHGGGRPMGGSSGGTNPSSWNHGGPSSWNRP